MRRDQTLSTAVRARAARWLSRVRSARYVPRWLVLGSLIGVIAGLGAVLFSDGLDLATRWLLTDIGGYTPAGTVGDGGRAVASGFSRPWAVPLVVAAGGLVSGLLVFTLAPEAEGHGTDAAIKAVHTNPKGVRPRVIGVKLLASMITIGSGGSGGREGPTAQISSGFGSVMARALNLTPSDARIAVSAGIASGIGAIFRAPLGGALLGAELVFRDDLEVEALLPSLVASFVAFATFGAVTGRLGPVFGTTDTYYRLGSVSHLLIYPLVGLVAGLAGRLYVTCFYLATDRFSTWRVPAWLKPMLAGAVVGLLGLAVPGVLGTGYGQLQHDLDPSRLLGMPWWLLVAVPLAKIAATSLSIGSGGSGGVFGPGLVIGGSTAGLLWRVLHLGGLGTHDATGFVIVGMVACFGAIAHAPLSVVLMVAEMTGNLAVLPVAMIAVAVAVAVVGDTTIYRSQLRRRSDSPAHRFSFGLPASASLPISRVMAPPRLVLPGRLGAADALARLGDAGVPGAPVVNGDGAYIGSVEAATL
ncbi:MAG TPA: chloride channel protein, partial [Acidimicrobiales bacterium]|nr:chloride channel protein [Acidimicrobiales bacterium]